jgi:hypothetical protein
MTRTLGKERRDGVDLKAKIRRTRWVVLLGQFPPRFIDFRSAFSQFSSFDFCKFRSISKYPLLNTFPFGGTEKKYLHILVQYTILKILNQKLPIFFCQITTWNSSMFPLFLTAHQSSTRIARISNKIKCFFMLSSNHKRKRSNLK